MSDEHYLGHDGAGGSGRWWMWAWCGAGDSWTLQYSHCCRVGVVLSVLMEHEEQTCEEVFYYRIFLLSYCRDKNRVIVLKLRVLAVYSREFEDGRTT